MPVSENVEVSGHLMDSGVVVSVGQATCVRVTVRSQRSDFPNGRADELYELVRRAVRSTAEDRGFLEDAADSREITDPVDNSSILDVWQWKASRGGMLGYVDDQHFGPPTEPKPAEVGKVCERHSDGGGRRAELRAFG